MAAIGRPSSRDRILAAAVELVNEVGPGHVSLDAVAQRAGVSKGGLLYNFPSKNKLMEAIVAHRMATFEESLTEKAAHSQGKADSVIAACVELYESECKETMKPGAGLLAALVENPNLLNPVRDLSRRLVDTIRTNASDESTALVVFLAIEGLRLLPLLDIDVLTPEERALALEQIRKMVNTA